MTFQKKLDKIVKKNNSLLCVGLDPDVEKLPKHLLKTRHPLFAFNKAIIDATHDVACCYKPNSAFYEAFSEQGIGELKKTCDYINTNYSNIPILLDFKRGDIGNTNKAYARFAFEYLGVDAVTVQPYQDMEAIYPFLNKKGKGIFILCKTSNPGSGEFQDVNVIPAKAGIHSWIPDQVRDGKGIPLYREVAKHVAKEWNTFGNCMLVVGATYPTQLEEIRNIVGDMTLLVPGLGSQGGEASQFLRVGLNSKKTGLIVNSSREVLYAGSGKDFAKKARQKAEELKNTINKYRT